MAVRELMISELYPYECSAISSSVEYHRGLLRKGEALDPVEVVQVEGKWLVINGTNRVYAAKLEGRETILVNEVSPDTANRAAYRATMQLRIEEGQKGFDNLPEDTDKRAREARTRAELRQLGML